MDLEGDKKDIINREIKFFRDLHKVRFAMRELTALVIIFAVQSFVPMGF